jgi:hypothetical protein
MMQVLKETKIGESIDGSLIFYSEQPCCYAVMTRAQV